MICYLNELIRLVQNAFIKERHIGDNMRLFFDVIDLTAVNKIPGSTFAAAIFEVFDSLNWDFMYQVVLKYCFRSTIVQ